MELAYSFGRFLITEWLWSITLGSYHIVISTLLLIVLFLFVAKLRMIPAVLLSVSSHLFALGSFTFFAYFVLTKLLGITFDQTKPITLVHPLVVSFLLGVIYTGLQALFFKFVSKWYRLPLQKIYYLTFASNTIASFIIYSRVTMV